MKITNYPVNYAALKKAIRKSAISTEGINFIIDFEKLDTLVADSNLVAVPNRIKSRRVTPEDVAYLSEFFKKGKDLEWINQYKAFSNVIFIRKDYIDDRALALMEDLQKKQIDDPDIDKVNIIAILLTNYPCYIASIVSYKSNDLKRHADVCLEIACKANKVTIAIDNKEYHKPINEDDPVEEPTEEPEEVVDNDLEDEPIADDDDNIEDEVTE